MSELGPPEGNCNESGSNMVAKPFTRWFPRYFDLIDGYSLYALQLYYIFLHIHNLIADFTANEWYWFLNSCPCLRFFLCVPTFLPYFILFCYYFYVYFFVLFHSYCFHAPDILCGIHLSCMGWMPVLCSPY